MDNTITTNSTSTRMDSIIKERRKPGFQVENPFTLKVGQVFTGFGVGCAVGIGVGRPLNLEAIPALQQVMSAARGATDAFSGAGRHVNNTLRRFGAKNIDAGVGCGVGFGHGFGAGIALKPGVIIFNHVYGKYHIIDIIENSRAHSTNPDKDGSSGIMSAYKHNTAKGMPSETSFGRTEKVISSFLQTPAFRGDEDNESVLKHQKVIDDLMEENEKLRQILVEELKVHPSKFQSSSTTQVGLKLKIHALIVLTVVGSNAKIDNSNLSWKHILNPFQVRSYKWH
ncbi:hypothetical protein MKX03_017684 [Papaver bracteatum]|nr:hypothetical protein MKX03_017684 [Papaver bracteatum]